jgi:hypothetical protein
MSKQTSTALNINDLFGDDNVDREHGDKAGQDPIALKSDTTSAAAPRSSRLATVNAADPAADSLLAPDTIHVYFNSGYCSYSPGDTVKSGGEVYLQSSTGSAASVSTSLPTDAFTSGPSPYSAPTGGNSYTLASSCGVGTTIRLTAAGTTSTGTITVGSASSPATINVFVNSGGFSYSPGSTVRPGGTVVLQSSTGSAASVSTSLPTNAFTYGSSPYSAPTGGKSYTLSYGLGAGTTIMLFAGGTTGTINVGGGNPVCPPDDDGDDRHHRDHPPHSRA